MTTVAGQPSGPSMTVAADQVPARLADAARHLPDEYRPDSQAWGQSFAHELLVNATPEVKAAIAETFDRFLATGNVEQATLAATTYPDKAGATLGIIAGLSRRDLPPQVVDALVGALGRAIQAGQMPYDPGYRGLVGKGLRYALMFGVVVYDFAWFLDNVRKVLGKSAKDAANALWMAASPMRQAEFDALRAGLESRRGVLGDAYLDGLLAVLDEGASDGRFATRIEPSRIIA